ncbi:hypothetical protein E1B28_012432 [Marasmius oreades]|uniref:Uncharacterized protein n=1 Tax=Marasmius oreades TaxID=181124 RepID=A0A9P7RRM9_9AGAR|nr:uncharacterized protein E1B28_012432 [Marasmius oreades]KAG7088440.1 hypothetical protein E1B28_012432 [Marasmius oreades]
MSKFGRGHIVDDSIERHASAFLHEEIPADLRSPVPGLHDSIGEGGVMQDARRRDGKLFIHELIPGGNLATGRASPGLTRSSAKSSFMLAGEGKSTVFVSLDEWTISNDWQGLTGGMKDEIL